MWGPRPQRAAGAPEPATGATNAPDVDAGATGATIAPCGCAAMLGADDEADRLRELVAGGMGQWEASKAIWGKSA